MRKDNNTDIVPYVTKHNKSVVFGNMEREVARLRKALEDIAAWKGGMGVPWPMDIAKEALGSKAWVLGNMVKPPSVPEREWYALRLGMGIVGKGKFKKGVPKADVPMFAAVVTDRVAAKELVCEKLDEIFDAFEEA